MPCGSIGICRMSYDLADVLSSGAELRCRPLKQKRPALGFGVNEPGQSSHMLGVSR